MNYSIVNTVRTNIIELSNYLLSNSMRFLVVYVGLTLGPSSRSKELLNSPVQHTIYSNDLRNILGKSCSLMAILNVIVQHFLCDRTLIFLLSAHPVQLYHAYELDSLQMLC